MTSDLPVPVKVFPEDGQGSAHDVLGRVGFWLDVVAADPAPRFLTRLEAAASAYVAWAAKRRGLTITQLQHELKGDNLWIALQDAIYELQSR